MTALPADVALFTNDGVVLTAENEAVKLAYPDAQAVEMETMFNDPAHGQIMLNQRFAVMSMIDRAHEAVELEDRLGLGTTVPIAPRSPAFVLHDDDRNLHVRTVVSGYSFVFETNRYAVELMQMPTIGNPNRITVDSTLVTVDNVSHTVDET